MGIANILQTTGIASQAGDEFDTQRQQRRMMGQREKAGQNELDAAEIDKQIFQMVYKHLAEKKAADEAAKTQAKTAPTVPSGELPAAPIFGDVPLMQNGAQYGGAGFPYARPRNQSVGPGYADGGAVTSQDWADRFAEWEKTKKTNAAPAGPAPSKKSGAVKLPNEWDRPGGSTGEPVLPETESRKFFRADGGEVSDEKYSGVYDDAKATKRLPSIMHHWAHDTSHEGYQHGAHIENAARTIVDSLRHFADGGSIYNGVSPATSFADGGEVKNQFKSMWDMVHHNMSAGGGKKKKKKKAAVKLKGGGSVRGAGTGTSDSVPATGPGGERYHLSNGEYVLSADTVRAVGKENLDALQAQHHTPVR